MYQTIMVPLDGSELAECVLPHVESLARQGEVKKVILSQVIKPLFPHPGYSVISENLTREIEGIHETAAKDYLRKIADRLSLPAEIELEIRVLFGNVADTLVDFVNKSPVDLIVIATHGRSGVGRWVLGSVADRLLHALTVPVLMIRAAGHGAH
jgi:nucleotide-binding universal stress UspA family protein